MLLIDRKTAAVLLALLVIPCRLRAAEARKVISLDGTWEIAEGSMDRPPERFERKAPVPGLADMAESAVDGLRSTRWSSEFSDPQWIAVDLGEGPGSGGIEVSRVELLWESAFGKAYSIQVSPDGKDWKDVFTTDSGKGGAEVIRFPPVRARWVRMLGVRRGTPFGYSSGR